MHQSVFSTFVYSWMLLVMESNTQPIFDGCWGDMIFIMDASSSIWVVDFRRQLEFVANLVDTFDIGPGPKQVGIGAITFSDHAHLDFPLDHYQNLPELKKAILNIPYRTGGTNTAEALKLLRSVLTSYVGMKKRPLISVVITDGLSWDSTQTKKEAKELHRLGINMQAIGVGYHYDMEELKAIASDPIQGVHVVTSYTALHGIADKFRTRLCEVITKEQTPSSTEPPPTSISSKIPTTERIEETNPLVSRTDISKSEHAEKESAHPGPAGVSTTINPKYTMTPTRKQMAENTPKSNAAELPNRFLTTTSRIAFKGSITDPSRTPISPISQNSQDREHKSVPPKNIPAEASTSSTFTMSPTRKQMSEKVPISHSAEMENMIFTATKPTSLTESKGSLTDKSRTSETLITSKSESQENKSDPSRSIAAGVSTTISSKFKPTKIEMAKNTPVPNKAEIPNGIFTTTKASEEIVANRNREKITSSPSNSENRGHGSVPPRSIAAGVTATISSKISMTSTKNQIAEKIPISNTAEIPNRLFTTTKSPSSTVPKGPIIDGSRMAITPISSHSEDRKNKSDPPSKNAAVPSTTMSSKITMESNRRPMSEETPRKSEISSRIFQTTKATSITTGREASAHKPQVTPMTHKSDLGENGKVSEILDGIFTSPNTITTVEEPVTDKPQTAELPINSKDRQNGPASPVNSTVDNVTDFPQKDFASTVVFGFDLQSMGTSRSNSILHFINYILPYIGYGKFALISNALCTQNFNIPLTLASNEDIAKHMKISLLRKLNQKKPAVLVDILRQMNEELFKDRYFQNGEKPMRKIGVLFVDPSVSEITSEVLVMAEKMKKNGFELFVISLGSYGWSDVKMFSGLSSQPYSDFLFAVPRYESLPQMVKYLPLQFRKLGNNVYK